MERAKTFGLCENGATQSESIGTPNVMELLLSLEIQISSSIYLHEGGVPFFGNLLGDFTSLSF